VLAIDFGLVEYACLFIGLFFGCYLQNTKRFEFKKWKKVFELLAFTLGGTIVAYLFDNLFNVASFSLFMFWIGIVLGYYGSLTYKEIRKSRLALIRGFARAGSQRN
jgi:hypothetical protein